MQKERLLYLLDKYENNSCSEKELKELEQWYESLNEDKKAIEGRTADKLSKQMYEDFKRKLGVKDLTNAPIVSLKRRWLRVSVAAVIIGLFATGSYLWISKTNKKDVAKVSNKTLQHDAAPGGNKAILTLADGSTIVLDSAANGAIAEQGNTKIVKLDSGQLAYSRQMSNVNRENEVQYNTINTPRGGQYQVTLSDGTKVWLNAASSLKYPTAFTGKERNVELTGEAYFEVAKNAAIPFHVKVNNMTVEVLGTHFNVMAYGDEDAIKTTLLEGAVKVVNRESSIVNLVPGQQAQLDKQGKLKLIKDADVDEAVAWKEGRFQFNGTSINTIMRQVSRWYNVDIQYKDDVSNLDFSGIVSRSENASKLLKVLEATGTIHFEINGSKIIVMRKK